MNHADHNPKQIGLLAARLGVVTGVLLALGFLLATRAFAAYEQVGIFSGSLTPPVKPGVFPEEVQLGGVGGMAVNVDGAGGVAPGTVYAATSVEAGTRVARFEPESDGTLKFVESWPVIPEEVPYESCGPALHTSCQARPSAAVGYVDVDVDQATGDVYVLSEKNTLNGSMVMVYSPDGSKVLTRFGEKAKEKETTASSPEKIHESAAPGGMAVDNAGDVYIFDYNYSNNFYHRLMEFVPQNAGNYEHYVYAGTSHDIGAGFQGEGQRPTQPVIDAAGDIYVAGEEYIQEYDPAISSKPVCSFVEHKGGIFAMTVDPVSGDVFYSNVKNKEIHRLGPCNGEGKFVEIDRFGVSPERGAIEALAFDPVRRFVPSREPGVLYGATPEPVPNIGGSGEPGQSALGYIFAPVREDPPAVKSESVTDVTGSSAELHAQIDPKGSETHYVFQFMTDAAFKESGESFTGASEAPVGGAVLDSSQDVQGAAVTLAGLTSETAYRYRVVASSRCSSKEPAKVCEEIGAVQSFGTFSVAAAGLPDGRAYELVSPIDKSGGQVFPADPSTSSCVLPECKPGAANTHFPMQSTPDGEAIVYEGSPFSPSDGATIENEYLSRRTGSGWQTADLTPPLLQSKAGGGYEVFDRSLTTGLFMQSDLALGFGAPNEYPDLYLQSTADPTVLNPLVNDSPLNHTPFNRLSGSGRESLQLAFAGASADLSRLFFKANDALTPEAVGGAEAKNNLYEWAGGRLRSVNLAPGSTETTPGAVFGAGAAFSHAISSDGARAFWSSASGQSYVRENGERTVEIPDHTGNFLTAAADGSEVLLSDGHIYGHLEAETPVEEADLTAGKGGFQGIAGQSEDLSHIYFVDTEVLSEAANGQGAKAQTGKDNLYAWHEGVTDFVATLLTADSSSGGGDWTSSPSLRTAEASPDGRWVAFLSTASLTGYDSTGPCEVGFNAHTPCGEAFLFDSVSGKLRCVSCNPSGAAPVGSTVLRRFKNGEGQQPQYLTDSGRLYFDTKDSLAPGDTNHGVEDVYEYEPEGVGTCKRDSGCVFLISGGTGTVDSNFLAMDATGKNVFFTTRDQLVASDKDQLIDLYDAREGGGTAEESQSEQKECSGETCANPPSPPLAEQAPGSFAFSGAGNLIAPPPANTAVKPKAKTPTSAQLLARAVKACKKKPKKKRSACERTARKKYGAGGVTAKKAAGQRKAGGRS